MVVFRLVLSWLVVASIAHAAPAPVFTDGFESGSTSGWSVVEPAVPPAPAWPVPLPKADLLTISAYDRIRAGGNSLSEFRRLTARDYDRYRSWQIDGEELWLNGWWPVAQQVMGADGSIQGPGEERLQLALDLAEARGLVLSLRTSCQDVPAAALRRFWRAMGPQLEHRRVIVDLCNEFDQFKLAPGEMARVASETYDVAPGLPVTISANLDQLQPVTIAWRILRGPRGPPSPVSFLTPHGPRGSPPPTWSPGGEGAHFETCRQAGRLLGLPCYGHEPHRRGYVHSNYPWPPAQDFRVAMQAAKRAGGVGWCLHNGAKGEDPGSFDLWRGGAGGVGVIDTLDAVELDVAAHMRAWWSEAAARTTRSMPVEAPRIPESER